MKKLCNILKKSILITLLCLIVADTAELPWEAGTNTAYTQSNPEDDENPAKDAPYNLTL